MKKGLLERILVRRYGQPISCIRDGTAAKSWNSDETDDEALLYVGMKWDGRLGVRFASLREVYGDAFGGILINNCIRVALLPSVQVFAVWNIDELRMLPAVEHAIVRDPRVDYFRNEHNVLFYWVKGGQLYVFDAETDELAASDPFSGG